MRNIVLFAACAALGACANSSGVHRTDADTYSVTVEASPGRGGTPAARGLAYGEAEKKCAPLAVQRVAEVEPERSWNINMHTIVLDFRCVPA